MFDIYNLPHKNDFKLDCDDVLNEIKKEYLQKYNEWMKLKIKEHRITISPEIQFALINDDHKSKIISMFTELGFHEDDILFVETTDTHTLWVRLKIY